ncbi:MAG: putative DNA-binding domain-containing protein [Betaproteobacteria bacterium]|jgi:hypothetical protein|nr:putative DNA-binding domain-containing protein [Betaproteobacteria bacterium]
MNSQTAFADALFHAELPCPGGLSTWNGSDPGKRFDVYRNNVMVSLVDALAETFAVTQALVGEAFFRAMARVFVQGHPPCSRIMAYYGQDFPRFIAAFPPAASVPYLADVARLEMARVRAYHAADAAPIDAAMLQAALGNPAEQRCLQLALHPSVQVVSSDFAVGDIWTAHHEPLDSGGFDPDLPQHVMVFRNRLHVDMLLLCAGDAHWVSALQNGHTLLNATVSACSAWPDFDLPRCLATLLRLQLFTPLFTPDECHEPVH